MSNLKLIHIAVAASLVLASGCSRDEAPVSSGPGTEGEHALPVQDANPPVPVAAKVDPATAEALEAGYDAIAPRMTVLVEGYEKVEPRQKSRIFMHPDSARSPAVAVDVTGLSAITLSPYMEDFSSLPDCAGNPEAGVVRLTWSVDGGEQNHVLVDRTYAETLKVDVSSATTLKLEADEANEVNWCDWLSVGFIDVE